MLSRNEITKSCGTFGENDMNLLAWVFGADGELLYDVFELADFDNFNSTDIVRDVLENFQAAPGDEHTAVAKAVAALIDVALEDFLLNTLACSVIDEYSRCTFAIVPVAHGLSEFKSLYATGTIYLDKYGEPVDIELHPTSSCKKVGHIEMEYIARKMILG